MNPVKYNGVQYQEVEAKRRSCNGCSVFLMPAEERPCQMDQHRDKFPQCVASLRKDNKDVILVEMAQGDNTEGAAQ